MSIIKKINSLIQRQVDDFVAQYHRNLFILALITIFCLLITILSGVCFGFGIIEIWKAKNMYPWFLIPGALIFPIVLVYSYHATESAGWHFNATLNRERN